MGHIKIDELSNSLKEYINTLGLTEEQVNNLIKQFSGDKTKLQTNAKGSLVDAINELFQSANNGKELIANAIGEPLNSSDTFSAMSTGINSLLSTFKTNMMNNGVSVAGSDKFKQLIDKIATLADSEGKGIKYAEGTYRDFTEYLTTSGTSVEVSCDLNFTPTLIFVMFDSISNTAGTTINNVIISNKAVGRFYMNYTLSTMISNMTSNGFSMVFTYGNNSNITFNGVTWYAIGVGEEDTTLRDSLASILQDEGVNVTPEDDMASLIAKVDSEFDRQVVPAGDAIASDVASGKTFMNNTGKLITGTGTSYINLLKNGGNETMYTIKKDIVNNGSVKLTHNDTFLSIYAYGSSYQTARCWMTINEAVDLTNVNMILFDFYLSADISTLSYMYYNLGVYEGTGEYNKNVTLVKQLADNTNNYYQTPLRRAKYVLDVSECTGTHKIGIYFGMYGNNSGYLNLYNVEMI